MNRTTDGLGPRFPPPQSAWSGLDNWFSQQLICIWKSDALPLGTLINFPSPFCAEAVGLGEAAHEEARSILTLRAICNPITHMQCNLRCKIQDTFMNSAACSLPDGHHFSVHNFTENPQKFHCRNLQTKVLSPNVGGTEMNIFYTMTNI